MALPQIQVGDGMIGDALLSSVEVTQELNQHWRCSVVCRQTEDQRIGAEEMLGKPVRITTLDNAGAEHTHFAGFVRNVRLVYEIWGSYMAELQCVSASYLLDVTKRKQYYAEGNLQSLAGIIAGRGGLTISVCAPGSKSLNYVQYGETDFDFLNRIVDDYGAWLRPHADGVEIFDSFQAGSGVSWRSEGDLLEFKLTGAMAPPSFSGSHYDHHVMASNTFEQVARQPQFFPAAERLTSAVMSASQLLPSGFEPQRARAMTLDNYGEQLSAESERVMGGAVTGIGRSLNQNLMAGDTLAIDGILDAKGTYGLIRVHHRWTPTGYVNDFTCTPWKNFRNPHPPAARQWNGVVPARVVDHNDPKKMGRIKVQFFWQGDGSTHWARATAPHAGPDRGFMFMPEVGDEVAVAFEDGDPERPVILGSMWNGVHQAPRHDFRGEDVATNDVKRLVTKAGNRMHLSDKPGEETIFFATPHHTSLSMTERSDQTGRHLITLHSDGDIVLDAPNGRVHIQSQFFSREIGAPPPPIASVPAPAPVALAASAVPAPEHASGIGGFLHGLWDSTVKPIGHMVMHPIDTVEGIGHAAMHPIKTVEAVSHAIGENVKSMRAGETYAMGTALGTVGTLFVPGAGEASALEDAAKVGKIGEIAEAGEVASDANKAGKLGEASTLTSVARETGATTNTADDLLDAVNPASKSPLTPGSSIADQNALKAATDPVTLRDATTFRPNGLSESDANTFLGTPEGQAHLDQLAAADSNASAETIAQRALQQLQSGTTAPTSEVINSSLFKIVPTGTKPTPYSPYFTTQNALNDAILSGKPLGDSFGLPLSSQVETYDIYKVDPIDTGQPVLRSTVAPTNELEGLFTTSGGAQQYIIPNRSAWSDPVSAGSIPNIGGSAISLP